MQVDPFITYQQWDGIQPQRFRHTEKIHLTVQNSLNGFQGGPHINSGGRQHFEPLNGVALQWKPHQKVDIKRPQEGNTHEFLPGKRFFESDFTQKKDRAERQHLTENKSGHIEDQPYGIKTLNQPSGVSKQYGIQQMMGSKNRVGGIEEMRNNLPFKAQGDKIYHHPDYSKDYFKVGGLIPGANISTRKVNINQLQDKEMDLKLKLVSSQIPKGIKWTDKVKNDARKVDMDSIDELEHWVENTLKEANPNYRDPDLFFELLEKQQASKTTGKDVKKATKK